jgi:hypothetical protein
LLLRSLLVSAIKQKVSVSVHLLLHGIFKSHTSKGFHRMARWLKTVRHKTGFKVLKPIINLSQKNKK